MKQISCKNLLSTALMAATVLLMALLFGQGQSIEAATGSIYVGGSTISDISSDANGATWSWDAALATLKLTSAYGGSSINISSSDEIKLVYSGDVTINSHSGPSLYCSGSLQIDGSGTLTINSTSNAIQVMQNLVISSGTIDANTSSSSAYCIYGNTLTITGSANLSANNVVRGYNGIKISTSGIVTVTDKSGSGALYSKAVSIESGTIYLNDTSGKYIESYSDPINISDGVTIYCDGVEAAAPSISSTSSTVTEQRSEDINVSLGSGVYAATGLDVTFVNSVATAEFDAENSKITITGVSAGTTTATVTWSGGLGLYKAATFDIIVEARDAETPTITQQPQSAEYRQNQAANELQVAASADDSGTLSYQWYSNTTAANSGGTAIIGATASSYSPSTSTAGKYYYYVIVTNTTISGNDTASIVSDVATVTVTAPSSDDGGPFTISFDTNGGTAISSVTAGANSTVFLSDYTTTRSGYTFAGWYSDAALTKPITSVLISSNTTVYAKWTADSSSSSGSSSGSGSSSASGSSSTTDTDTDVTDTDVNDTSDTDTITLSAYIGGYDDGTFRPDGNVSRAEVAQMLYNIIGANDSGQGSEFSDVSSNNWYYAPVTYLTDAGIVSGYKDGTFKPNINITRAEFVTLVVKYAGLTLEGEASFTDVSGDHWAYQYIAVAKQAGYIGGYEDSSFRPDSALTRAEAVTILNAMLGLNADEETLANLTMPFSDVPKTHWAYYQILEAAVAHEHE